MTTAMRYCPELSLFELLNDGTKAHFTEDKLPAMIAALEETKPGEADLLAVLTSMAKKKPHELVEASSESGEE